MKKAKRISALLIALTLMLTVGCGTQPKFDISQYVSPVTCWATEDADFVSGGYTLDIYNSETTAGMVCLVISYMQGTPASRIAFVTAEISPSEIKSNTITYNFSNDGWGHSGNVTLTFKGDAILFTISDVECPDDPCNEQWGIHNAEGVLVNRPTFYDDYLSQQNDYYASKNGQGNSTQKPVYDTSKASGILASLGMTEQVFRDSCIPLNTGSINSKTTVYYVDCDELLRYPNNYVGQHFVICNNYHDYLPCQYCSGIDDSCAYSSDFPPQRYDENGLHWVYQSDLTVLVPESFSFYNEGVSSDGYPLYSLYVRKPYCYIFDMRDDIYSPNIATDANVTPYLIFLGLTPDGTDLRFAMITCDASFN